jgi:hypothetical protein
MRKAFAHEALLVMDTDADSGAPGAAVTESLCGSWEHEGPCPLAPHHTTSRRDGEHLRVRVLFAVEPELEDTVRQRVVAPLALGRLTRPGGVTTSWQLADSRSSELAAGELEHAARLAHEG